MAAPKKNEFYKIRKKDGRNKKYTPEKLKEGANAYFNWCINNPLIHYVLHQKTCKIIEVPHQRPFTELGLCIYLAITFQTLQNYEKTKDFFDVIRHTKAIIRNQKFEGAAAGFFNHNIIARDLGLVDKREVEEIVMSPEDRQKRIDELKTKIK